MYSTNYRNHHASWTVAPGTDGIAVATGGFSLVSPARPGFMLAHFQGGQVNSENTGPLPAAVREQLQPLLGVEYASVHLPVLGPKFFPKDSSVHIAGELQADISHLVRLQLASAKSPFVTEALEKVVVYMKSMPVQQDDAQIIPSTNLKITSPAIGPIERQIALALKQSLGITTFGE
jgi:hypothetical protein